MRRIPGPTAIRQGPAPSPCPWRGGANLRRHRSGRSAAAMVATIATLGLVLAQLTTSTAFAGAAAPPRPMVVPDAPLAAPVPVPAITARAVLAVDLVTGATLAAVNPDMPYPPASTTKMLTALIVRHHAALDEVITIEPGDLVDEVIYAHVGLRAGDRVAVRDQIGRASCRERVERVGIEQAG